MTDLVNPHTGTSLSTPRLLSLLMEMTTEPSILTAMMKAERANAPGLALLADHVRATRDKTPEPMVMNEEQIAASVLSFLVDAEVRGTVARYVSLAHQIPYKEATCDLWEMREEISQAFNLRRGIGVPTFFAEWPVVEGSMQWPEGAELPNVGDVIAVSPTEGE